MKTAIPTILALVLASGASAQPKPAANNPQELIDMEAAWAKAAVARDFAALSRIVAPDWHGQNHRGKLYDRAAMIQETVAGHEKLTSMANHDLHVRFLGPDQLWSRAWTTKVASWPARRSTRSTAGPTCTRSATVDGWRSRRRTRK